MKANYIHNFEEWAADFKFSVSIKVRFSEIDMFGIMNNAVTFSYFEYARIEFMKNIGVMGDLFNTSSTVVPVIADAQCDYIKPSYYNDEIELYVKASTVGNSSVDIHYMAKGENDALLFTGRGTMVQMDKTTGKGYPWTEKEKSLFIG